MLTNLLTKHLLYHSHLLPSVDTQSFLRILKRHRYDPMPLRYRHPYDVGEIVLALSIVWLQLFQRTKKKLTRDDVGPHIDFFGGQLGQSRIPVLNDLKYF